MSVNSSGTVTLKRTPTHSPSASVTVRTRSVVPDWYRAGLIWSEPPVPFRLTTTLVAGTGRYRSARTRQKLLLGGLGALVNTNMP